MGMGGLQNLWKQHNPGKSKACQLAVEKKKKLKVTKRSQPGLQTYFTKRPKDHVAPSIPIPRPVIVQVIKLTSSVANVTLLSPLPNTLINLLADLEKAISDLPSTHPVDTELSIIPEFPQALPMNMD